METTPAEQVAAFVARAEALAAKHGFIGHQAASFVIGALTLELETALAKAAPKPRRKLRAPLDLGPLKG
jgi:hypothetical protein